MSHLRPRARSLWNLFLLLICLVLVGLFLSHIVGTQSAGALPVAQATPTCPPSGCEHDRVYGYQPRRYDMRSTFNDAASNALGRWWLATAAPKTRPNHYLKTYSISTSILKEIWINAASSSHFKLFKYFI